MLPREHSSSGFKVSGFSEHLRRGASDPRPAMTFRERGSGASVSCSDQISVVTRRKFAANCLKAISAVIESLRK